MKIYERSIYYLVSVVQKRQAKAKAVISEALELVLYQEFTVWPVCRQLELDEHAPASLFAAAMAIELLRWPPLGFLTFLFLCAGNFSSCVFSIIFQLQSNFLQLSVCYTDFIIGCRKLFTFYAGFWDKVWIATPSTQSFLQGFPHRSVVQRGQTMRLAQGELMEETKLLRETLGSLTQEQSTEHKELYIDFATGILGILMYSTSSSKVISIS